MEKLKKYWLLIVAGVIVLTAIVGYNGMVGLEEKVDGKWAQVENVYQRRADLIPNLVATVKGYASHEKEALTAVIEARAKATSTTISADNLSPEALKQFSANQQGLSSALGKLMVVVERYPDLKANQNFLKLQSQLEGTENRIAKARKDFTEAVRAYNTKIRKFPNNIFNKMFGFEKKGQFEAKEGADIAPTVDFE